MENKTDALAQQQATTLAPRTRDPLPFVPENIEQAWKIADLFSKANLIPDALRGKPYDVLIVVLAGAEYGIPPMVAIREVTVVRGRPMLSSLLKTSLVKRSPLCEYFSLIESTDAIATFETKRRGDPKAVRMSFTYAQAEAAGLTAPSKSGEPSMYSKYRALMLRRRAASQLADEVYPDETRAVASVDEADTFEHEREIGSGQSAGVARATMAPPLPVAALPDELGLGEVAEPYVPRETLEAKPKEVAKPQQPPTAEPAPAAPAPNPDAEIDVLLAEIAATKNLAAVDAILPRAKAIQGPRRQEVGNAVNKRRRELKGAA